MRLHPPIRQVDISSAKKITSFKNDTTQYIVDFTALIIDGNPIVLEFTAAIFEMLGYRVRKAANVTQAIWQFHHSLCEVVLADCDAPHIQGLELAQRFKALVPATRVILTTERNNYKVTEIITNKFSDSWLFKPYGREELKGALSRVGLPDMIVCSFGPSV
jgi:DNA-binding NtrC family response regulator